MTTIQEIYKRYQQTFLIDTDTRKIRKNAIFFALKGANFNGNTFAKEALNNGASIAIIDEKAYEIPGKTILVKNVLTTLQELAKYHRKQLTIPVIGLTGSNGKTTTKELLNVILQKGFKTTATTGNLNNHIGVPLSILSVKPGCEIAIIEMGANHQKEIAFLSEIAAPDYGYITNFGKAHLEGFGGVEGVIKGKSELYTYLIQNNKTAFVNPKDPIQIEKTKDCKTILINENIRFIKAKPFVSLSYNDVIIESNLVGKYNYNNIAIAVTVGIYFKIDILDIKSAIEAYTPSNNRSQIIKKATNTILLDAYNANPSSMEVALENFANLDAVTKTVILGDMFELGIDSAKEHQAIAKLTDNYCFSKTIYVGEQFYQTKSNNLKFKNFNELKSYLEKESITNQTFLIKGSRGMQLERIVDFL
ncbi:UDP-N-acetylmuramoyl-tripeptide--D-alanyl-D-alanine ligase [uncultured Polaribacter sp.]|uniref:UDP-N-acetylmuramoyl-tripeptide--D-alanyl-D- alanine ligase n=1 Tax=uncultured Polaribacter sp. TaxID=174711 RepID=UPI00262C7A9D|nr:UDP-N-acetylmuramoyl-tripeptide--D-alanyl-D-alanine ligase [uncultured Polaribacter sp.]